MFQTKSIYRNLGMEAAYLVLVSARPRQWVKNLLVYFAFLFTINVEWSLDAPGEALALLGQSTLAFLLLCAVSGAVYLVNDWADRERDRLHPRKRHRPIAAGRLKPGVALAAAGLLGVGGVGASFLLAPGFGAVMLLYLLMMLGYSFLFKHLVIVDVLLLGAGFVLRAAAGAAVISAPISPWLYVVTGLGALFLGFGKRRSELVNAHENSVNQRGILQEYTPELLDHLISVVAPSALLAYMLYTFTAANLPANNSMMLTIPFVAYGLFRYLYLIHRRGVGERPEDALLTDLPLLVTLALWLFTASGVLFLFRE